MVAWSRIRWFPPRRPVFTPMDPHHPLAAGRRRAVVALLVAGAALAAAAEPPHPAAVREPADATPRVAVVTTGPDGERALEGRVVVRAADGGMLLQLDDQRLEVLRPAAVRSLRPVEGAVAPLPPRELGTRILADLPEGFSFLVTDHYVVCHDTPKPYAEWCGALFERLHGAFIAHWRKAGLEVASPPHPLVVVIFSDRERYETFSKEAMAGGTRRAAGFYDARTNRVTTFDLTRAGTLARRPATTAARAGLQILSTPQAAGLVSTLVHEAIHQLAFNCGLHQRLAPVPVWVAEGLATYGERGWREIDEINRPLLDRFLADRRPGDLEGILDSDASFRDAEEGAAAYARAWALTAFLARTRPEGFATYQRLVGAKHPLSPDSPARRREDFVAAFGAEPQAFEEEVAGFLARWGSQRASSPPEAWRPRGTTRPAR